MPAFADNKNVMCYLNDIYVYLRARSQDAIPRGRPAKHATSRRLRRRPKQMHGSMMTAMASACEVDRRRNCSRWSGWPFPAARARRMRERLDRTGRSARLSSLRRPARSSFLQRGRRRFRKQDRRTFRAQARQVGRLHVLSRRDRLHPQHAERPSLRRRVGNCSRRRHRSADQPLLSHELCRRVSQGRSSEGSRIP